MAYVRDAAWQDFFALSRTMREADVQEVMAASGLNPLKALASCYFDSPTFRKAICTDDGLVVGLFGLSIDDHQRCGRPWLLASDGLTRITREFIRQCPQWIAEMHKLAPLLYNYTDERNSMARRWLKWCGFTFIQRHEKYGHEARPFLEFVKLDGSHHLRSLQVLSDQGREDSCSSRI